MSKRPTWKIWVHEKARTKTPKRLAKTIPLPRHHIQVKGFLDTKLLINSAVMRIEHVPKWHINIIIVINLKSFKSPSIGEIKRQFGRIRSFKQKWLTECLTKLSRNIFQLGLVTDRWCSPEDRGAHYNEGLASSLTSSSCAHLHRWKFEAQKLLELKKICIRWNC